MSWHLKNKTIRITPNGEILLLLKEKKYRYVQTRSSLIAGDTLAFHWETFKNLESMCWKVSFCLKTNHTSYWRADLSH